MNVLDEWTATATAALGVDGFGQREQQLILELAKVVAHGVVRPGAPVTAYLMGVAVGRGADPHATAAMLIELVGAWQQPEPTGPPAEPGAAPSH